MTSLAWSLVDGPDFFARVYNDASEGAEFRDTNVNRYIADLSYEISPLWTVKSVTSFVDTNVKIDTPDGYTSFRDDVRDYGDLSQDFQLTYDNPDSPFSGVFGLYTGRYEADLKSDYKTTALAAYGVPEAYIQKLDATNLTRSTAIYTDMRYDVSDRVTLLGGGRLLHDVVSADYSGYALNVDDTITAIFGGCAFIDPNSCPIYSSLGENSSVKNTVFLPKVGLAFELTDSQTLAGTVSQGYRA